MSGTKHSAESSAFRRRRACLPSPLLLRTRDLPTMSCCGEPNKPKDEANRVSPYNNGTVTQQPGPHPGAQFHEKQPSFQQPNIPSPIPSHPYGQNTMNTLNSHQHTPSNWSTHSPSPPPTNQFGAYGTPGLNNTFNGSVNGFPQHQPLLSPSPTHNASHRSDTTSPHMSMSSPPMTTSSARQDFRPPSDEGKMSVSIDFGKE